MINVRIFNLDLSEKKEYKVLKVILKSLKEGDIVLMPNHMKIEGLVAKMSTVKLCGKSDFGVEFTEELKAENAYFTMFANNFNLYLN